MIQQFKILQGYNPKKHNNLNQLQIYNTVLSTPCSLNNTDMVYFFQNNTVLEMFQNRRTNQCDLKLINKFYGTCLNRHISSYIQHGQLNTNQRKRATNLLLYPRIKHLTCGISQPNTKNTLMSALQIQNRLLSFPEKTDSRMFAVNVNVKQKLASQFSINKTVKTWANLTQNSFVQWLSNNISQTIGRVKENQDESSWVIFNGTSNISWKKNLGDFFASSFRRKSFVWHYTSRGMDEMQFTQSQSTLNDLISEYTVYDGYVPEQQEQIYQ